MIRSTQHGRSFNNFKTHVQSWYVVEESRNVKAGHVVSKNWLDRRIAIFRGADGTAQVVDGQCPHLGADLGLGCVVGNDLRCGFHHWQFDREGKCKATDSKEQSSSLFAYPTEEKYGAIWAFNGRIPSFQIPSEPVMFNKEWGVEPLPVQTIDCHPHIVSSNGLDLRHFQTVHQVQLRDSPRLDTPNVFSTRLHLELLVGANNALNRLLCLLGVKFISMTFATWGGNLATSHSRIGNLETFLLFANQPIQGCATESRAFLMIPRSNRMLNRFGFNRILLKILKRIIGRMLRDDIQILRNMQFTENFTEIDAPLSTFVQQVNAMSQFPQIPVEANVNSYKEEIS